jgi:hypothetical protein
MMMVLIHFNLTEFLLYRRLCSIKIRVFISGGGGRWCALLLVKYQRVFPDLRREVCNSSNMQEDNEFRGWVTIIVA